MDKPLFKTFASAEGFTELLRSAFLALILTLKAAAIEPSQTAIDMANRLKNNEEVSCCDLKREYRRMALELHPDKEGGTHEDMVLLNYSRDSRTDCSSKNMRGCSTTKTKPREKRRERRNKKTKKKKEKKKKEEEKTNVEELVMGTGVGVGVGLIVRHLRKSTDDRGKKYNMPPTPERTKKKTVHR